MDCVKLKEILNKIHISDHYYCLAADAPREDRWVLNRTDGGEWEVYFWERGYKNHYASFEEEEGACAYFLNQFIGIGGMKMNMDTMLPLGSIVQLKGGTRKMIIVARALQVQNNNQMYYFDYGAVPYPLGVIGDQMAYFQQDTIERVFFVGYVDKDEKQAIENVKRFLADHPDIKRGSKDSWK